MHDYTNKIQNLKNPTFQKIRKIAVNSISHLSKSERDKLWEETDHGKKVLDTHELLCQYLWSFGNMHEAKIKDAVSHLPKQIFNSNFEVVDWGCGQGIGTVCFLDYLKKQGNNNVSKVTLIEPSEKALDRARLHINTYIKKDSKIITIPKYLDDVTKEDINQKEGLPVIHFFSNILDIPQIDLKLLATKIDKTVIEDNYIVIVSPIYANSRRVDAFYDYFKVPVIYDYENRQFDFGGYSSCSYKAKVYKLGFNEEGNLIPIVYYPSVQFHAAYLLDSVYEEYKKIDEAKEKKLIEIHRKLMSFETSTPFDIGASVYDDIHPILAVLNNIITRGLPTKKKQFTVQYHSLKRARLTIVNYYCGLIILLVNVIK